MSMTTFEWHKEIYLCVGYESGVLNIYRLEQMISSSSTDALMQVTCIRSMKLHQESILCLHSQTTDELLWTSAVDTKIFCFRWQDLISETLHPPRPHNVISTEKGGNGSLATICHLSLLLCGTWQGQIDIYERQASTYGLQPDASISFHMPHTIVALFVMEWKPKDILNWPLYYALPLANRLKQKKADALLVSIVLAVSRQGVVSLTLYE